MRINKCTALICWPFVILAILPGCREQENQIREREAGISRAKEEKRAAEQKARETDRELAQIRKENREKQAARDEMRAESAKSEARAKLAVQFRSDLEASLQRYTKDISDYRQKYLTP